MRLGAIIMALVLAGCVSAPPETVTVTRTNCLLQTYVNYTAAQQALAANELEMLQRNNPNAELPQMMTDYGRVRAAQRACK